VSSPPTSPPQGTREFYVQISMVSVHHNVIEARTARCPRSLDCVHEIQTRITQQSGKLAAKSAPTSTEFGSVEKPQPVKYSPRPEISAHSFHWGQQWTVSTIVLSKGIPPIPWPISDQLPPAVFTSSVHKH